MAGPPSATATPLSEGDKMPVEVDAKGASGGDVAMDYKGVSAKRGDQRLARPGLWSRDQDHRDQWVGLVIETETETQTSKVSRPRLIETKEFPSCRDRDLSRLDNLVVVETETHRVWMKIVETETLTRLFKEV